MYIGFKILPANPPTVARALRLPRVPEPVLLVEGTVNCKPYVARVIGPSPIYGVERKFLGRKTVVGDPSQYATPGTGLRTQVIVSLAGLNMLEILELRGGMSGDDLNAAGEAVKSFYEYRRTVEDAEWVASLRAIKLRSNGWVDGVPTYSYVSGGDWFQLRQTPVMRTGDPPEGRVLPIVKLQGAESLADQLSAEARVRLMSPGADRGLRAVSSNPENQRAVIRRQAEIIARLTAEAKGVVRPDEPEPEDDTPGKRIIDLAE